MKGRFWGKIEIGVVNWDLDQEEVIVTNELRNNMKQKTPFVSKLKYKGSLVIWEDRGFL